MTTSLPNTKPPVGFWSRLRDGLFSLIVVVMIIAVLAFFLRRFAFDHVDEEIRSSALSQLETYFPGMQVELKSARLLENEGIALRGLSVKLPDPDDGELYVEEIFAASNVDLQTLISSPLKIDSVRVRGVDLYLRMGRDWKETLSQFFPRVSGGAAPPPAELTDVQIELREEGTGKSLEFRFPSLVITDNRLAPTHASELGSWSRRRVAGAKARQEGEEAPPPVPSRPRLQFTIEEGLAIRGVAEARWCRSVDFTGRLDPSTMDWEIEGHVETLEVTSALLESLPFFELAPHWASSRVQGKINCDFHASSKPGADLPITFGVFGELTDGKVDDPRLTQQLVSIEAKFDATSDGFFLREASAEMGEAKLRGSARIEGYTDAAPQHVKLIAQGLRINKRLWQLLPPEAQRAEQMFSPRGVIDLDLTAKRLDGKWIPNLKLTANGLSLAYEGLPYPLTDARGTVIYRPGELKTERFTARAAGELVRILVDLQFGNGERFGVIDIASQGPIPIDERLLRALKPAHQKILREFDARGAFTVDCNVVLDSSKMPEAKLSLDLDVVDGSISYHRFPYPINQIQGKITVRDGLWELRGLTGRRDSAYITCDGSFTPTAAEEYMLSLNFIATDVPFSDELRLALPQSMINLWDDMQPRGSIDHLKIDLKIPIDKKKSPPDIHVVAQKWNDRQNVRGRSISIEPILFPLRIDQVVGKVRYHNGRISLMNVEARHGSMRIVCSGEATPLRGGGWQATFSDLLAERVNLTPEVLAALPPRLRGPIESLQLAGQFLIRGNLGFALPSGARDFSAANWDLRVDTEDGSLNAGAPIDHIRGGIRLFGDLTGKDPTCFGELQVDSLRCRNSYLSNLRGPLSIDSKRVMLGAWSTASRLGTRPNSVSANFCSGRVTADCGVELTKEGRFAWRARFEDIDLAELARDSAPALKGTTGRATGQIDLQGTREGSFTWRGGGEVQIRDAKMYELPVFLAALKNIGAKSLDKSAFHTGDVRFGIAGEDISFEQLDFQGDGIEMKGTGDVTMQGDMDLKFGVQVGPEVLRPKLFSSVMGAASRQLLVIEAKGSVQSPDVRQVVFPGVNEFLNQLFPENKQIGRGPPSYAPARATTTSGPAMQRGP